MARSAIDKAIGKLRAHDHACLIYRTKQQQLEAAIPYIRVGLAENEQCVYIADENTVDEVLGELRAAGIDVDSAQAEGRLAVVPSQAAYLREGSFDVEGMMGFLDFSLNAALEAGFSGLRVMGEMSWVIAGDVPTERLFEYEARLNEYAVDHCASGV